MIVGVSGPAGAGKSTAAMFLRDAYGYRMMSFAEALKRVTFAGFGIAPIEDRMLKETVIPMLGISYRRLAQIVGTEWGRHLRSDLWITLVNNQVQALAKDGFHCAFTDLRFPNEEAYIRSQGVVWHVLKEDAVGNEIKHVSEQGIPRRPEDAVFVNDMTMDVYLLDVALHMKDTYQLDPSEEPASAAIKYASGTVVPSHPRMREWLELNDPFEAMLRALVADQPYASDEEAILTIFGRSFGDIHRESQRLFEHWIPNDLRTVFARRKRMGLASLEREFTSADDLGIAV